MTPLKSLIHRMGVRYKRIVNQHNAGAVCAEIPGLTLCVHSHQQFRFMIQVACHTFPDADFRWLMRFDDANFMHDVLGMFACLDPETGAIRDHFEPRFVSRSRAEAAKKGARK